MSDLPANIEERYGFLMRRLGVSGEFAALATSACDNGRAHVEGREGVFWYVMTERGQELERKETRDADELLYWLAADVTFSLASRYAGAHREAGRDFRRVLFARQVELLASMDVRWAMRKEREHCETLRTHPFRDQG